MLYYCYIVDFSFEEQLDTVICTGSDVIFTVCVVIEHSYERLQLAQDVCVSVNPEAVDLFSHLCFVLLPDWARRSLAVLQGRSSILLQSDVTSVWRRSSS